MTSERRAAAARKAVVGRQVIAVSVTRKPLHYRLLLNCKASWERCAEHAPERRRAAPGEQVGFAVSIIVDRVSPLPCNQRQYDQHRVRGGIVNGEWNR